MRRFLLLIHAELLRLGLDEEWLVTPASPPDDGSVVALSHHQETTAFLTTELLIHLQACSDEATSKDVWQAILPAMLAE